MPPCLPCHRPPQADEDLLAEREKLLQAWTDWRAKRQAWVDEMEAGRVRLLSGRYAVEALESDFTVEEVEVEETIERREEPYR